MRDLPSGTVTFLFTDVEGSTRLLHELGVEAYTEALAEHRRVIREACTRERGVEVDTQGDAFFFAFSTAPEALAAASALTQALSTGPIKARVGLHTGTPLLTDEGYTGSDVVLGARIASSAHGGQVVLSSATRELLHHSAALTRLGDHRFKDVEAPVSVYQLGSAIFAPLKTISNTNLPRPASSFVGRQAELAVVLAQLAAGARLLTLTGPGGSGKTRLAIEAASALVPEYQAGIYWVGLSALRDPALVTETIAQTLGAKDGLEDHIGEREMLVLLDNLEQVIDSAPELASLLARCPNITLLVTSRELLRVSGEVEYPVLPLAEPEAVTLFCQRSTLEPTGEISTLCTRLDSMPLAVELAAARTKAMSPAQILERLSGRLDLLKGGRDADPRQQTLRATIEWSHDLLSLEEQELFARLAIFAGTWTLEAAEEVCDADLDILQSLVEKSLVRFSNERYWMFETIQEYARERLHQSGEADVVRIRHMEFFVATAEAMHREWMYGTDLRSSNLWFRTERDNLRAAVESAADRIDLQLALLHAIRSHWTLSPAERRRRLEAALSEADDQPAVVRARALAGVAEAALFVGDIESALAHHEQAVDLYRSLGDEEGVARSLVGLGREHEELGRHAEARKLYEEALETARRAPSPPVIVGASTALAYAAIEGRDFERALSLATELEDVESGEWRVSLVIVGLVALERGDVGGAARLFRECVAETYEVGAQSSLAFDLDVLAAALAASGNAERAAVLAGHSEALRDAIGSQPDFLIRRIRAGVAEAARRELGDERYRAALARGASMSVDEAVQLALADA
ncbi:MAG: ATP-binding protein [Gaiellaceae bacterium]